MDVSACKRRRARCTQNAGRDAGRTQAAGTHSPAMLQAGKVGSGLWPAAGHGQGRVSFGRSGLRLASREPGTLYIRYHREPATSQIYIQHGYQEYQSKEYINIGLCSLYIHTPGRYAEFMENSGTM